MFGAGEELSWSEYSNVCKKRDKYLEALKDARKLIQYFVDRVENSNHPDGRVFSKRTYLNYKIGLADIDKVMPYEHKITIKADVDAVADVLEPLSLNSTKI